MATQYEVYVRNGNLEINVCFLHAIDLSQLYSLPITTRFSFKCRCDICREGIDYEKIVLIQTSLIESGKL